MLIYRQLTVAVLGCEIWCNNISVTYALEYVLGLVHQNLANCLSFLDVWIQQQKCRRST